ncbi:MAG: hypothetical protein KA103_03835 [Saprospiraceae bacterium]|nr:hypothetical protein [Saprospiraceae bacterium]
MRHLIILILFISPFRGTAQLADTTWTLLYQLKDTAIVYFTTDKLQQYYTVTNQNAVTKYDANNRKVFAYQNKRYGKLSFIDATDPFYLLLYYQDFQAVVILDRTLNFVKEYNLNDWGFYDIKALGLGNDHHVWLYDNRISALKKISEQGNVIAQSERLHKLVTTQPNIIQVSDNHVYLVTAEAVLIFDLFGQFLRRLDIPKITNLQAINNTLLLYNGSWQLCQTIADTTQVLNVSSAKIVRYETERFFVLTDDQLLIYKKAE